MRVYAINGGPRKDFSTAKLLDAFLEGAAAAGERVQVRRIDLYDLNYKGCTECFACKLRGGASYGKCAYPDDLKELLGPVSAADVLAFGSPVYFGNISGQLRCFLERLYYPFTAFQKDAPRVIAPRKIRTAFLYAMNVGREALESGFLSGLGNMQGWTRHVLGFEPELIHAVNCYQYRDPENYVADIWDWEEKARWREEEFPKELQQAFDTGRRLTLAAMEDGE